MVIYLLKLKKNIIKISNKHSVSSLKYCAIQKYKSSQSITDEKRLSELEFYNSFIEKPVIKHLLNEKPLSELPLYKSFLDDTNIEKY